MPGVVRTEVLVPHASVVSTQALPSAMRDAKAKKHLLWALVPFFLILLLTRADFQGDTLWYATDITSYQQSSTPDKAALWDFGHLLWRPTGLLLYRALGDWKPYAAEPIAAASFILILLSIASSLVCILLFQAIGLRMKLPVWLSTVLSTSFFCFYAVLEYSRSGAAYVPGLMFSLLAAWFALRAVDHGRAWPEGICAGISLGLAVLVWAPYLMISIGILGLVFLWKPDGERRELNFSRRTQLSAWIALSSFGVVVAGFGFAARALDIHSIAGFREWVVGSAHGWSQSQRLIRMATGLPRSFISLRDTGIALKRYFFHDPYAPVSVGNLALHHFWKLVIFYAFGACFLWSLIHHREGRRYLGIFAVAAIPVFTIALFVFESGAPERYLPFYPFLCLALAYALRGVPKKQPISLVLFGFLILITLINVVDLRSSAVTQRTQEAMNRLQALEEHAAKNSMITLPTQMDEIYDFTQGFPLSPLNRNKSFYVHDAVKVATDQIKTWKQEFAALSLRNMKMQRQVWVSRRVFASQPDPSWKWTEGDDRRITWKELPLYFEQFEYGPAIGGSDGFVPLLATSHNQELLSEFASGSNPQVSASIK